jgi:hydrogenase maturation protein HypF
VASIIGIRQLCSFEGQAAMELEAAIAEGSSATSYPYRILETDNRRSCIVDWEPCVREILRDLARRTSRSRISLAFHNTLSEIIVAIAKRAGEKRVVLSGGCFQNKFLAERTIGRLIEEGFEPFWHRRIPPNDGGISVGQIYAFMRTRPSSREISASMIERESVEA